MLWLVISLPIFSAVALAQTNQIIEHRTYGIDEVDGFFRESPDERITMEVTAVLDETEDVTPADVGILYLQYDPAFEDPVICHRWDPPACSELTGLEYPPNTYMCTCVDLYTNPFLGYRFYLDDHQDTRVDLTSSINLYPEREPPQVTIEDLRQEDDMLSLSVALSDTACSTCGNICAGVKEMEIYDDGNLVETIPFEGEPCSFNHVAEFSVTGDGTHNICVKALDNMHAGGMDEQHESPLVCEEIEVDLSDPSICPDGTFQIMKGTNVVEYYSIGNFNSEFVAHVLFTIEDSALVDWEVDAHELHLSAIYGDPNIPGNYLNLRSPRVQCVERGAVYECRIMSLAMKPSSSSPQIHVTAEDEQGNVVEGSCSTSLTLDNDKPVSNYLRSGNCAGDDCFVKPGRNRFESEISESGAGLLDGWTQDPTVYLDLSSLNNYNGLTQAWACTDNAGTWTCTFYGEVEASGKNSGDRFSISIVFPSMDDAGNPVDGVRDATVTYDDDPPFLTEDISIETDDEADFFTAGDNLNIQARVDDTTSPVMRAVGDFHRIKAGENHTEVPCTEDGDGYLCEWHVTQIEGPHENVKLDFFFYDAADNELVESVEITVYEGVEEDPNFWRIDYDNVEGTGKISKGWVAITNVRATYSIPLEMVGQHTDLEILTISGAASCRPSTSLRYLEISPPTLFNNQRGSTNPFMQFTLKKTDIPPNTYDIPFNCTLNIQSRKGLKIYPPELENFSIKLEFFGAQIDELHDNVKSEIQAIKDSDLVAQTGFAAITKLQGAVDTGKTVCNIISGISALAASITSFTGIMALIPPLRHAAEAIDKAVSRPFGWVDNTIMSIIGWTCAVFSCSLPQMIFKEVGLEGVGEVYGWMYREPEASMISSIATLCIPGLIHNVEKARQVECKYASCLRYDVPANMPLFQCTSQRNFDWCKYVYKQKIQSIPFIAAWNYIMGAAREAVTNPLTLIFGGVMIYCNYIEDPTGYSVCSVPKFISNIIRVIGYINNFGNDFRQPEDYCATAFDGWEDAA